MKAGVLFKSDPKLETKGDTARVTTNGKPRGTTMQCYVGVYIYGVSDISEFAIIVFGMSFVLIKVMDL